MYRARKEYLLENLKVQKTQLGYKVRFVECLLNDQLIVRKQSLATIQASMTKLDFPEDVQPGLLKLPISVQTQETIDAWKAQMDQFDAQIDVLTKTTELELWRGELAKLRTAIETHNKERDESMTN